MPLGTPAGFRGTLQADPAVLPATFHAALAGFVEPGFVEPGFVGGFPPQTFTGTLSRARIDAWDGELTYAGVRVVLAGQEIPQADLVGVVGDRRSIDTHLHSVTIRLAGFSYSIHRTEKTWTRTPVQVYFRQRAAGAAPQEVLRLDGVVRTTPREVDHEGEPALDVTLADLSAVYDRYRLCHEVPPYSGLTDGAIAREVCADAGIPATDIPEGERYDAPLQVDGTKIFDFLWQWGERRGWHWRWEGHTLTAYVPTIKEAPQAPDHVWTPREIETLESDPPEDVPSRWTVRGFAALYVDELGIETELTRTEERELYAPAGAVEQQDAAGNRTPVDFTQPEALRLVRVIEEERQRRGTRELLRRTREHGWFNLAAAKGLTVLGPGTSGLGWDWTVAYVDSENRFVVYPVERFGEVGLREEVPAYDGQGTRVAAVERAYRHHRRTHGIRQTGIGEGDPQTAGVGIGDDDQSYLVVTGNIGLEAYGLAEESRRAFTHHQTLGAALREDQDEHAWYSPKHALDVAGGHRLYDGSAQADLIANFIRVRRRTKSNVLAADARLRGTVEIASGYAALRKHDGANDFGGAFGSHEAAEEFRTLGRKNTAYIVRGHNQVEEVTYEDGERLARIILGGLPIPTFLSSPWVELVQEPLELVIDDPVVEQWFGVSQESIDNPYIQNQDEAFRVYRNRRARALAPKLSIGRAETLGRPGDTVLVLWPPLIAERYLLVEADTERDPLTGRADATYRLEHPL